MNDDKQTGRIRGEMRILISMLAAVLLFLLAIPSFAMNVTDGQENRNSTSTDQTEQEEVDVQAEAPENAADVADSKDESAEEPAAEEIAAEDKDHEEEPAAEDPGSGTLTPERPALKAPVLKALPANNTKVSYTSAGSHPVKFTVKSGGYTFKGTCATLGVDNASSGKATVKRISNSSKIAKLVYYYGYKKGWWKGSNSTKKATTVMGFTDKNCTENAKQCIEALIQRDNMGWTAFWNARKSGKYRMYSTDSFVKEINELYKKDVSKITIPDDVIFEMFHGETSSSKQQDFYVWRYKENPVKPNGFVAVEKVSADVSITN